MRITFRHERSDSYTNLEGTYRISVDGVGVVDIMPLPGKLFGHCDGKQFGWYSVIRDEKLGLHLRNTCGERGVPLEQVKADAKAYIKAQLAKREERLP